MSADGNAREEETEVDEATLAGSDAVEKPRRTAKQRVACVVKWMWNTLLEQWFLVGIAVVIALASVRFLTLDWRLSPSSERKMSELMR